MTALAAAPAQAARAQLLWEEELAALRTAFPSLPPAAQEVARGALESILREARAGSEVGESASALLAALGGRSAPPARLSAVP